MITAVKCVMCKQRLHARQTIEKSAGKWQWEALCRTDGCGCNLWRGEIHGRTKDEAIAKAVRYGWARMRMGYRLRRAER